jgi:acyl-CoA synthetase (AMP-forming)/AMP-acid ligase II
MKGRKEEITKLELYHILQKAFPSSTVISEYGMTELLSQAYSDEDGLYTCPPWVKVLPRADNDPLSKDMMKGHTAALNIIDLANINSCCFIATDDLGRVYEDGRFEVTGRLDQSDIRGCSLMAI